MAQRPQQRRLSALSQHLTGAAPTAQSWPSMVPEKGTSKPKLAIVSTHFDHVGQQARLESAAILRSLLSRPEATPDTVRSVIHFSVEM